MLTIYVTKGCDYCKLVKRLCDKRGIQYESKDIGEADNYKELKDRISGRIEMPSIFNGQKHIGWYTDFIQHLDELEKGE